VLKTPKHVFICFVLFAEQTAIIPCTAVTDWSLQWECECYCDATNWVFRYLSKKKFRASQSSK